MLLRSQTQSLDRNADLILWHSLWLAAGGGVVWREQFTTTRHKKEKRGFHVRLNMVKKKWVGTRGGALLLLQVCSYVSIDGSMGRNSPWHLASCSVCTQKHASDVGFRWDLNTTSYLSFIPEEHVLLTPPQGHRVFSDVLHQLSRKSEVAGKHVTLEASGKKWPSRPD